MSNVLKGVCWAVAILLLAVGNRFGLIGDSTAQALFAVLPVIAVLSMRTGLSACCRTGREAA